jgi:hypothetical protein
MLSGSSVRPSQLSVRKDSSAVKCCSSSHRHPDPYDAAPVGGGMLLNSRFFRRLKLKKAILGLVVPIAARCS